MNCKLLRKKTTKTKKNNFHIIFYYHSSSSSWWSSPGVLSSSASIVVCWCFFLDVMELIFVMTSFAMQCIPLNFTQFWWSGTMYTDRPTDTSAIHNSKEQCYHYLHILYRLQKKSLSVLSSSIIQAKEKFVIEIKWN